MLRKWQKGMRRPCRSDMLREALVFGPIHSRRLGSSLGINLLPTNGKLCNFDCVYCECGLNADGRSDRRLPTARELRTELDAYLQRCRAENVHIDSITFSGDGEPTLNPEFADIVDVTLSLRDRWYPHSKVSVLTNATRISRPEIFAALRRVDNPILKLDAVTAEMASAVNAPQCEYDIDRQIADMKRFEGDFIMQTMLLKGPGFDSADMIGRWKEVVRELRPREVQLYTISRPVPVRGLVKYTAGQMRSMVQDLIDEGHIINIYE